MRAIIQAHINREGFYQFMQIYTNDGYIQLSGNAESYIRACILMGIKDICIYVSEDHKGLTIDQARTMKQDMLDCFSLDYATKRGRKPTVFIRLISPIDGRDVE